MSFSPRRPVRLSDLAVQFGLATGLGTWLAPNLVARWLSRPARCKIGPPPEGIGEATEEVDCTADDGLRLRGWVVTPSAPRATIVLFHGLRKTREGMLSRARLLVPAGFRCVLFDHRAHGASDGRITSFGYHERLDVQAVLRWTAERWPRQPLLALGVSMGAAAICFAADEAVRLCQGVVLESLYHDIVGALHNRLHSGHYPPWFRALTPRIMQSCERRLGVTADCIVPADHIAALAPRPFLLIGGSVDAHATPEEASLLLARRRGPGELLIIPHAGHEDVCETGGSLYRERLLKFLDRCSVSDGRAAA